LFLFYAQLIKLLTRTKGSAKGKVSAENGIEEGCLAVGNVIVYVWRQRDAEAVAENLQASGVEGGIVVYHGGMDSGARSKSQSMVSARPSIFVFFVFLTCRLTFLCLRRESLCAGKLGFALPQLPSDLESTRLMWKELFTCTFRRRQNITFKKLAELGVTAVPQKPSLWY
jgi:hypothetical protein